MRALLILFDIIATLLSLATLGYVGVDVGVEVYKQRHETKPAAAAPPPPPPPPEPEPEPEELPEPVDEIDAVLADLILSDERAMSAVSYERGAGVGQRATVNLGEIDRAFNAGDIVTMADLKEKGLVPRRAGRVKILADGILHKPLTVKAEAFSVQAIKMLELTGGRVVILRGE